jgi:hypothetical protein
MPNDDLPVLSRTLPTAGQIRAALEAGSTRIEVGAHWFGVFEYLGFSDLPLPKDPGSDVHRDVHRLMQRRSYAGGLDLRPQAYDCDASFKEALRRLEHAQADYVHAVVVK